jgi:hypothetical protein
MQTCIYDPIAAELDMESKNGVHGRLQDVGDQAIAGIDAHKSSAGEVGLIASAFYVPETQCVRFGKVSPLPAA